MFREAGGSEKSTTLFSCPSGDAAEKSQVKILNIYSLPSAVSTRRTEMREMMVESQEVKMKQRKIIIQDMRC